MLLAMVPLIGGTGGHIDYVPRGSQVADVLQSALCLPDRQKGAGAQPVAMAEGSDAGIDETRFGLGACGSFALRGFLVGGGMGWSLAGLGLGGDSIRAPNASSKPPCFVSFQK